MLDVPSHVEHDIHLRPLVWILDDRPEDQDSIAENFEAAGYDTAKEGEIDVIGELAESVQQHRRRLPDVIVLDQHWQTDLSSLEVVGRQDIAIESQTLVGLAIGRYLRSFSSLHQVKILMTSAYGDGFDPRIQALGDVVTLPKGQIFAIKKNIQNGMSSIQALGGLGLDVKNDAYVNGALQFLYSTIQNFDMEPRSIGLIVGMVPSLPQTEDGLRYLIRNSRDARNRVEILLVVITALRAMYGDKLPAIEKIESDLKLPVRSILLGGSIEDLLRVRRVLEARAGGPL
ncbi:MAG: hypothetical protein ING12_01005 [Roseomonas sp.]|jgi:CheY-like chemotaxis protein|nr:hypothetical protein [Roseomonas sp.]